MLRAFYANGREFLSIHGGSILMRDNATDYGEKWSMMKCSINSNVQENNYWGMIWINTASIFLFRSYQNLATVLDYTDYIDFGKDLDLNKHIEVN